MGKNNLSYSLRVGEQSGHNQYFMRDPPATGVSMSFSPFSKLAGLLVGCAFLAGPSLLTAQAGSLDSTFGTNGIVTTSGTSAASAALQSDGKIVVAGSSSNGPTTLRYNINGTLDPTFGTGGQVTLNNNNSGAAFAVAIESDGKILVAAPSSQLNLAIYRLNANGSPDTSFGSKGVAIIPSVGVFLAPGSGTIAPQSDGKILVTAQSLSLGTLVFERLLSNGTPDSTFGTAGAAPLVTSSLALALQSSSEILVLAGNTLGGAVARYEASGSLDATFGGGGQAAGFGTDGAIAVVESSSEFLVGGSLVTTPSTQGSTTSFLVVRYAINGNIETTFGSNGIATASFPGNHYSTAAAVALQSNGDIVAGGLTGPSYASANDFEFALARFTASGRLDETFGTNGLVTTTIGSKGSAINTLLIQVDGKILAVGNSGAGATIARYLSE
jgi:uncharacterized delta-60 repeat protein